MGKFVKQYKRHDSTEYLGPVNSWKALGIAIVRQAVIDWRSASLALAKVETASHETLSKYRSADKFLRSPWCEVYSGLDGPTLVRRLKEGKL